MQLQKYRQNSVIIMKFSFIWILAVGILTNKAVGQASDENNPEPSSDLTEEDSQTFVQASGSDESPLNDTSPTGESWSQRLTLSGSQWSAAYNDQQKNHVTQTTKNISGLSVKGQTLGISWLIEKDSEGDYPQAWLYQGNLSTWSPQSEYWLRSTVAHFEGGFGIIPASGPKMLVLGVRYQKNSYKETDEKWSEVHLEDQALITIGTQLRHTIYDTDWGLSIYLRGKAYALFWVAKYSGYGAEATLGVSQIFGDDWRLNLGLGVEQQQIASEAKSPYNAPLTLFSELQSFPMIVSLDF